MPLSFYFIFWEIVSTSSFKFISCIIFYQVTYSYCPKIIYSFLNHAPFSQWKWKWSHSIVSDSATLWTIAYKVWLCDPVDCSLSGSSLHGIFQARILEWVAISFSRGSSRPRDQTQVSRIASRCFNLWATREARFFIVSWFYFRVPYHFHFS